MTALGQMGSNIVNGIKCNDSKIIIINPVANRGFRFFGHHKKGTRKKIFQQRWFYSFLYQGSTDRFFCPCQFLEMFKVVDTCLRLKTGGSWNYDSSWLVKSKCHFYSEKIFNFLWFKINWSWSYLGSDKFSLIWKPYILQTNPPVCILVLHRKGIYS